MPVPVSASAPSSSEFQSTLGLFGLTMNAMALIAPGAFLWLTFYIQASAGPTGPAMWMGIVVALLLCLATAFSYSELAKLYPGTGGAYYFAEQSFLNHHRGWRYTRLAKFIVGWSSHLYYWVYPGVMVGTMGILCGYLAGTLWPKFLSAATPGPLFIAAVAGGFSFLIAAIAYRGVESTTRVNTVINFVQIAALVLFSVCAIGYRLHHPPGSVAYQWDAASGSAYDYQFATRRVVAAGVAREVVVRDAAGAPVPRRDAAGKVVPFRVSYPERDAQGRFLSHPDASSVISARSWNWTFIQATVAILILVGFESVTAMGGEARRPRRDVPRAVILSLLLQGAVFYLLEYFAANYVLSSGYTLRNAAGSAAPIGDLMVLLGNALWGPGRGELFMLAEAGTVFLALIGTTLACISTGARVTYAMGKDREVPEHFGLLHDDHLTPHRAIWSLALVSAVVGGLAGWWAFAGAGAPSAAALAALPHNLWARWGFGTHAHLAAMPNSLLLITLLSNFGTFVLYGLSNVVCMVAYHRHPKFSVARHLAIPLFGLLANVACVAFYLIGPLLGYGSQLEPEIALAAGVAWALYGYIYFVRSSREAGREMILTTRNERVLHQWMQAHPAAAERIGRAM